MASSRDSIADIWGPRTPTLGSRWPVRVDQNLDEDPDRWVQASCFLCSNGCGVDIGVKDDRPGGRMVGVRGRTADVVNRGRLGPKGLHGWVADASTDRLTHPLIRRGDRLERAGWDEAMDLIVRRMREVKERYTAGSIGFYTSGQLFAEENYTLGVIATAGIGTVHIDGNTRLCTATAGAALKETFGSDGQPGAYEDIDVTDCFLLVGHDMAATATVLWARVLGLGQGAVDRRYEPGGIRLRLEPAAEALAHRAPKSPGCAGRSSCLCLPGICNPPGSTRKSAWNGNFMTIARGEPPLARDRGQEALRPLNWIPANGVTQPGIAPHKAAPEQSSSSNSRASAKPRTQSAEVEMALSRMP